MVRAVDSVNRAHASLSLVHRPGVLHREQELIFRPAWQYVGHIGAGCRSPERSSPRARAACRSSSRAPATASCAHSSTSAGIAASRWPRAPGKRETLQCPYHAWTYGLDGSLRSAPRSEELEDFDRCKLGLVQVALDTWGPFVFVNTSPTPSRSRDALGSMPAQVAELGLDVDDLVFYSRWETELDANWKIVCENFLECYHCSVAHPQLAELLDVSAGGLCPLDRREALEPERPDARDGARRGCTSTASCRASQFHFLWPNLGVNIFPGRPNISIGPMVPRHARPDLPLPRLLLRRAVDQTWIDELMEFDDQVGQRGPGARRRRPPRHRVRRRSSTAI